MQDKKNQIKRNIDGILLLDKPLNLSSNAALQIVKRFFAAKKAGHTGSLDPLATGMLPICFGEATKFSQYLLDADKYYYVVAKLGEKTATGDAEGEVVEKHAVPALTAAHLEDILAHFRGSISQVPSMYSALKYQGKPLYELARQGITVERPARTIQIYELNLINYAADTLTLEVKCSKGTYIRTLVEDIGNALGCGAHVITLRRLRVAGYQTDKMVSLAELEHITEQNNFQQLDKYLLPVNTAVQHWPLLNISEAAYFYLRRGQPILIPYSPTAGWVSLMIGERFVGIGEVLEDGKIAPRRLIAA
jgi:tRNA pseudouridine55 synthase